MCVSVFEIHVLKIFIERWFWELNMLIGSLVELHVGLHSCLCFSHFEKLVLKAGSTPPWYLDVYRASSAFSYRNLDSFSKPSGSIEKAPASSIAPRHLVDRSSFCSWIWWVVPRYLLDTSAVDDHFLDTYLDSFLDTCIYQDLLRVYIFLFHDSILISSIFLDLSAPVHLPNTLSLSHSKHLPLWFFKLCQNSSCLGKFLISYSSCISCFET